MQFRKISNSVMTAGATVLGLIGLLLVMASVSGGFSGLSGLGETMAYSITVILPLVLVVFVSVRLSGKTPKPMISVAPSAERSSSHN